MSSQKFYKKFKFPPTKAGHVSRLVTDEHEDNKEGLARMYADYDKYGFPGGNALVLRAILGREPRTLNQYIYELASR